MVTFQLKSFVNVFRARALLALPQRSSPETKIHIGFNQPHAKHIKLLLSCNPFPRVAEPVVCLAIMSHFVSSESASYPAYFCGA